MATSDRSSELPPDRPLQPTTGADIEGGCREWYLSAVRSLRAEATGKAWLSGRTLDVRRMNMLPAFTVAALPSLSGGPSQELSAEFVRKQLAPLLLGPLATFIVVVTDNAPAKVPN